MIRIMIADDEEYEREYLARFIKEHYQGVLKLVFAAKDGAELLLMAQELTPEIGCLGWMASRRQPSFVRSFRIRSW